ncbi:MAG: potassium transporter TrkA, partial [Halioglobus sp.]|nr:potassium transporter TrkA [Halioglobus sp.]
MPSNPYTDQQFLWRGVFALLLILLGVIAFESGVSVSERPEIVDSDLLTKTYYSLSLFVISGVDLGTPQGGPLYGRVLLWFCYFGAPILAASTLLEALLRALAPQSWSLRRLKNHVIIAGDGELPLSTLKVLRQHNTKIPVVAVVSSQDELLAAELKQSYGALVVTGDISHEFLIEQLRVREARRVFLLGDNSLRSYEAAAHLIERVPGIADRVVIHCSRLRFMRAMENTAVAKQCEIFNTYHLAASGLVRGHLIDQFRETRMRDVVVLAGFGRFGQTILEELQKSAIDELDTVAIIDKDAHRRVLVADEQMQFSGTYRRELFEGDVAHPEMWERVQSAVDITGDNTVFVLGTGREEENLRTALWLRRLYPKAMIISRTSKKSLFASQVGQEHNIISISITQLVEDNLP